MTFQLIRHQNRSDLFVEVDRLSLRWRKLPACDDANKCGAQYTLDREKLAVVKGRLCSPHDNNSRRARAAASMHHAPTSANRFCGNRFVGDITVIAPTGR